MRKGLPPSGQPSKFGLASVAALTRRYHVVGSFVRSLDKLETVVAGDFVGTREAVERHARIVARGIHERWHVPACADVIGPGGEPVFSVAVPEVTRC